jgi:hypothetical protein
MIISLFQESIIPRDVIHIGTTYLAWSLAHVLATKYYSTYCAQWSFWGLLKGGIQSTTMTCKSALLIQKTTSDQFNAWIFHASSWVLSKLRRR